MLKHLLLASTLLIPTAALGQAYDHSDWTDGTVPTRDWTVLSTKPVGTAPADTFEPADVGDTGFTASQWISNDVVSCNSGPDACDFYEDGPSRERKVRFLCEPANAKVLDPILFRGIAPPVGHGHQFYGNANVTQNSNWASLRASPSSTCAGGPHNGTAYWETEMKKRLPNGVVVGVRPQNQTFYYVLGIQSEPMEWTWLRRDFRFITGNNPNNFNDAARRAEYAAGSLEYPGTPDDAAGFGGWQCYRGSDGAVVTVSRVASRFKFPSGAAHTDMARHLVGPGGADPWGGNCTGSIAQPGSIIGNLYAPGCWDRHNLGSPDGREHVAFPARKIDNSVLHACPTVVVNGVRQHYGRVPELQVKTEWKHAGPTDYLTWYLTSDVMNAPSTPGDATSKDECRQTTAYFCKGATLHADWWNGWRSQTSDIWQKECLGITVRGVAPTDGPAECNTSTISKTQRLKYAGASPDPAMSGGCATINSCSNAIPGNKEQYNPLPAGTKATGPITGTTGTP